MSCPNLFSRLVLALVFSSVSTSIVSAQNQPLLERLTINDGLSQGYVNCLTQDADGFVWIGTKNGLNRYDGRQMRVYTQNPFDSTTISEDWVSSLSDEGRYLWIGTRGGGLNILDKKTGKAQRFRAKKDVHQYLSTGNIYEIIHDSYGNTWILAGNSKIGRRLLKIRLSKTTYGLALDQSAFVEIDLGGDFELAMDTKGTQLWGVRRGQIFKINVQTGQIQYFDWPAGFFQPRTLSIVLLNDSLVGITLENKIARFDGKAWATTFVPSEVPLLRLFKKREKLFVSLPGSLLEFAPADFSNPILNLNKARLSLPMERGRVLDLLYDRSGIYWMGTSGYGILKYNPRKQGFKQYYAGTSVKYPILPDTNYVRSLYVHYPDRIKSDIRLEHILADSRGDQYVLFRGPDETKLNWGKVTATGAIQTLVTIPDQKHGPASFTTDKQGFFWIALNDQLVKVSPAGQGKYQVFHFDVNVSTRYRVNAVERTPDNRLWIATEHGLVEAIPRDTGLRFRLHTVNPNDSNTLQNNDVLSLLPDPANPEVLWIGTRGGGLNRLDIQSMKFAHRSIQEGFPDNVIYGILSDQKGSLWLSSNKGIIRYNPATGSMRNYTVKDGLPTNEFNSFAYAKRSDGTIFFGCVDGLIVFHPESFIKNPVAPNVKITGLKVNSRHITTADSTGILTAAIEYTPEIILPYYQNNLTLEFAALEYSAPSKNKFRYYLAGLEQAWAHEDLEGKASYFNLSPGTYIFKIKGANTDGVWSAEPTSFSITILAPWYRTTAAYIVYFLLSMGLLYAAMRFLLNRQNQKHLQALERREAELLRDSFIREVHHVVEANMEDENFGVQELCRTLGISRTQLHQKIKARTGKSTSLYLRTLRLRKARQLLLTTDLNVSEISIKVGFRHLQHFSKFYFEEFGEQPSKTR